MKTKDRADHHIREIRSADRLTTNRSGRGNPHRRVILLLARSIEFLSLGKSTFMRRGLAAPIKVDGILPKAKMAEAVNRFGRPPGIRPHRTVIRTVRLLGGRILQGL